MQKAGSPQRSYVIFGPGRVGCNVAAWLDRAGHATAVIDRAGSGDRRACEALVKAADVVCVALADQDLGNWLETWGESVGKTPAVDFSGAMLLPGMLSYHPLYSFPRTVIDPGAMDAIAFARQENAPPLAEIFPGTGNKDFLVRDADRPIYHALAVLSGNFAAALWNETAHAFEGRLGLQPVLLGPYLASVVDRFSEQPLNSLTGPVARKDRATVETNLNALAQTPKLKAAYAAFLALTWPDFGDDRAP